MNYAIIKDNIVSNIVEWDGVSEFSVDGDIIAHDITYIGNTIHRKINFFNTYLFTEI